MERKAGNLFADSADERFPAYDIIAAEEKQAAAKQTFVFLRLLMSKRPMKSDKKR